MSEASDCDSYTKSLANIGWKGNVFFGDTNKWAIIFFQENILKYEWNDNVPHKSLSTWRWQSKKTNQNILILYQRTKNTHNVSGKISPKIRMSLTHQKITKILLSVCSSKNVVNTLLAILLNISMTLTKQKKTYPHVVCRGWFLIKRERWCHYLLFIINIKGLSFVFCSFTLRTRGLITICRGTDKVWKLSLFKTKIYFCLPQDYLLVGNLRVGISDIGHTWTIHKSISLEVWCQKLPWTNTA